jgi:AmmeMemoRadiSam system protein B
MRIRQPAVAGSFYPVDPDRLRQEVDRYLAAAPEAAPAKALVVPHAGHIYSGPIAATAYATLRRSPGVRRVVLLGPSHFSRIRGLALPDAEALRTPLGTIPVDASAAEGVRRLPQVVDDAAPHLEEHSLEVQLPFLQRVLGEFTLVPFAVGSARPEAVAEVLDALWGGPETLILISTDLSHYLPYDEALRVDRRTAECVVALDGPVEPDCACGSVPLNGLLHAARRRGLKAELLDLRNSGDTAGDKDRVVGYGAFALREARA